MTKTEKAHEQLVNARNWLDQHHWIKGDMFTWSESLGGWKGACARGAMVLGNYPEFSESRMIKGYTTIEETDFVEAHSVLAEVIAEFQPSIMKRVAEDYGKEWAQRESAERNRIIIACFNDTRASKKYVIHVFDLAINKTAPEPKAELEMPLDSIPQELIGC
jgi:hypothetical protein